MADEAESTSAKSVDLYDEYTFFASSTQTLADRRQTATQVYLGVNTSIFALIGFLLNDAGLEGSLSLAALPLFIVGGLVCFVWDWTICHYRNLINWRFEQLMAMEKALRGSYQMFTREHDRFFEQHLRAKAGKIDFSRLERRLPHIILALYVVYGGAFLISKLVGL